MSKESQRISNPSLSPIRVELLTGIPTRCYFFFLLSSVLLLVLSLSLFFSASPLHIYSISLSLSLSLSLLLFFQWSSSLQCQTGLILQLDFLCCRRKSPAHHLHPSSQRTHRHTHTQTHARPPPPPAVRPPRRIDWVESWMETERDSMCDVINFKLPNRIATKPSTLS